jgi:hypothetical protein
MKTINSEVSESAVSLLEENEQLLRSHAKSLIANISRVLTDRRKVEADNAKDVEILAGMAATIEKLNTTVDPSDLDALQNLAARKDQLARLTVKYSDEAKERLATADANIAALNLTNELTSLIEEGRLAAIGQISLALRPFFPNDALLAQFAVRIPTMNQIARHSTYAPDHVSTVTEIENAVRDLIQPIAEGCPPWMFKREGMA